VMARATARAANPKPQRVSPGELIDILSRIPPAVPNAARAAVIVVSPAARAVAAPFRLGSSGEARDPSLTGEGAAGAFVSTTGDSSPSSRRWHSFRTRSPGRKQEESARHVSARR